LLVYLHCGEVRPIMGQKTLDPNAALTPHQTPDRAPLQKSAQKSAQTTSQKLDRRAFASLMPALLAAAALPGHSAEAQANPAPKAPADLPVLESNTFKPGPPYGSLPKHVSHHYLLGMLQAGNIRLEMHETTQDPGAVHEPTETHLHSEIWLVREGVAELYINGVIHRMEAGDVGLVCAGDKHWVRNGGDTQVTYFVVTVGPPEPAKA